ncbi:MAG: alpha/beta hydrolase, partial [Myxococcales bacterium]|nr:alpha/beta hydrolase [Myxococcales bacterium]
LAALEAARMEPETVAAVVLCQTPSFPDVLRWTRRVDFKGLVATPVLGQVLVRATRRRLARAWYDAALPEAVDRKPYLEPALQAYDQGADYCLASALQAVQRSEPPRTKVEVPVLSIWGALDRTHRRSDPAALAEIAPHLDLRIFDDAGHFPDLEQPRRFADEVLAFSLRHA